MSLGITREILSIQPTIIGNLFGIPISNSSIYQWFIILLVSLFSWFVVYRFKIKTPTFFQVLIEATHEGITSFISSVAGSARKAERVVPLASSVLLFILLQNVLSLIPGISSIMVNGQSLFRTATTDFNTTFGLAVVCIIIIQINIIKDFGVWGYINNYVKISHVFQSFRKGIKDGMLSLVDFFISLLDIIGEFAKVLSLSLRLFGNLYAGEVLMTILIGIFAVGIPAAWLAMSVLGAVVQSIVFAALVSVFFALAIKES